MDYEKRRRSTAARRPTSTCRQTEGHRRAHRRGAQDFPDNDELHAAVVLEASAEEGRRGAAERRIDHGHRRRAEAGAPRPRDAANPKTQIRPRRGDPRGPAAPRATGRSRSCPRSRAPSSRSIRAPARSAPWWAASTTRRASSTTSRRPGASRARASSPSSTRPRSRRASRRPR